MTGCEFRNAQFTIDAFAELGRSESLAKCRFTCCRLSAGHFRRLAEIRIAEGLQRLKLVILIVNSCRLLLDSDLATILDVGGIEVEEYMQ